jgi:hypothetical protein
MVVQAIWQQLKQNDEHQKEFAEAKAELKIARSAAENQSLLGKNHARRDPSRRAFFCGLRQRPPT